MWQGQRIPSGPRAERDLFVLVARARSSGPFLAVTGTAWEGGIPWIVWSHPKLLTQVLVADVGEVGPISEMTQIAFPFGMSWPIPVHLLVILHVIKLLRL